MNNIESQIDLNFSSENLFNKIINLNKDTNKKELIEIFMSVDAHYGHRLNAWNPMMAKYLFAEHAGVHIIDLTKTIYLLKNALNDIIKIFSESNARMLFVGSKEQLTDIIKNEAERCGQYYVNYRWFGGTLTNWGTIQKSIKKMDSIEREMYENRDFLSKKETASKNRILNKLENSLGGIRNMSNIPDIIFVTDTKKEKVSIAEANKLGIPVIALLDSNSNPHGIDYPIPCNDDNQRAVALVTQLIADAVLVGMEISFAKKEAAAKQRRENDKSVNQKRRNFVRADQLGENNNSSDSSENSNKINNNEKVEIVTLTESDFIKAPEEATTQQSFKTQSASKLKKSFISVGKKTTGFSSAASNLMQAKRPIRKNTEQTKTDDKPSE